MTWDEKTYQQIDSYLQDVMSRDEKSAFEKRMDEDPDLAEEVKIHEAMHAHFRVDAKVGDTAGLSEAGIAYADFLKSSEGIKSKVKIAQAEAAYFRNKKSNRVRFWVAASISVVLLLTAILYNPVENSGADYQRYYAWNELPSLTERSNGGLDHRSQIVDFFNKKEYESALKIMEVNPPESTPEYLYKAISQFETGNSHAAQETLDLLLASDLLDRHHAHWYKALIYLKMEKNLLAGKELELILSDDTKWMDTEARELLEDLEMKD